MHSDKGDILCEMRFYVPNNELEAIEDKKEDKKKDKKEKKKGSKSGEEGEGSEDESESEEEEIITPAKVMNDKIIKAAGIGEFAGEVIASLPELPMLIPRGKYTFDLYATFAKLHGRTHDYKISYKDINRGFLLPKPDGVHMAYILHLKSPLRQGQTLHHYIAMQFDKEQEYRVKVNLSPEQLKEKYDDKLQPELEGPLYDVLSKLFKELIKINILIPGDFRSNKNEEALKCSVKASDGYLYPLKSSLIFIHKPVIYIKHSEIKFVKFSRVGSGGSGTSRSFDVTVSKMKDDSDITFAGIDKEEHKNLMTYFKTKNIKVITVDVETNQQIDLSDEEEDMSEEESKGAKKRSGANGAKSASIDEEYDSEEDEDFNEEGSPSGSESEEASDEDASMEEEEEDIDEDEVKEMKKQLEAQKNIGKRERKGAPAAGSKKAKK